jgi:hypothetical protein
MKKGGFSLSVDVSEALIHHPGLITQESFGKIWLKGKVMVTCDEAFQVEIHFPPDYPYCFPHVWETGGRVIRTDDNHVYPDGHLCICTPVEEKLRCVRRITFTTFINEELIPHLAGQAYFILYKSYPMGERSHGMPGIWESYYDLFQTSNKQVILDGIERLLNNRLPERNQSCFCGKPKKFKHCHLYIEEELNALGHFFLDSEYHSLKSSLNPEFHA